MFLEKIIVKDFKHIEYLEETFSKVNVFEGKNGQGKSSLFEALILVLCNHTDQKLQEYIRWTKKKFSISAVFTHLNTRYEYNIKVTKSTTERELIINDDEENKIYNSDVVAYIKDNILDPTITLSSNISIQHKGTELLFEKPTPKFNKLKKIFKIEDSEKIAENLKREKDSLELNNEKLNTELKVIEGMVYDYQTIPDTPEEDIDDLTSKFKDYEEKVKLYEKEKIDYNYYLTEISKFEDAQKNLITEEESKKILEEDLSLQNKKIETIEDFSDNALLDLKKEHDILLEDYNKLSSNKIINDNLVNSLNDITNKEADISKEMENIILRRLAVPGVTKDDIEIFEKEKLDREVKISSVIKDIELAKQGKCPTCKKDYTGSSLENLEADKLKIKEELSSLNISIKEAKDNLVNYESLKHNNDINRSKKDNLEKQLNDIVEEKQKIELEKNNLEFNESDLSNKLSKLDSLKEDIKKEESKKNLVLEASKKNKEIEDGIKTIEISLSVCNEKINNYKKIKKPNEFKFSVSESIKKDLENTKEKIDNYKTIINDIKNAEEYNSKIEKSENENKDRIKNIKKSIETNNKNIRIKKTTRDYFLKNFPSFIINKGTNYIKAKMNEFFNKAYGKFNIDFENDGKGITFFYKDPQDNLDKNVNMLSGWEKSVYANSSRIALISLQPDVGIFLGDEIDSDADEENSLILYKTLLNENLDQFFFITHYEKTKEYLRNLENSKILNIVEGKVL
jgi:DNA repair exonuclease SbcCD ATPase subunit